MKDLQSFIIPYCLGNLGEVKALAYSGASINVMPYNLFQKLDLGDPMHTCMTLQKVDYSVKHPHEVIDDVLMKIDKYIFSMHFVVLDVNEDVDVPLILGRSFLRTSKEIIDMDGGKITLRVGNETVTYKLVALLILITYVFFFVILLMN